LCHHINTLFKKIGPKVRGADLVLVDVGKGRF
jgi:hypothetical protein